MAKPYLGNQHICDAINLNDGNKNNLRTIETQIVQEFKNNEARPKFTGSYKNACKQINWIKTVLTHSTLFSTKTDI